MKLSRRELAASLTLGAAFAQTASQAPASPEAELQAAREEVKANVARLASQTVPMTTEPAFHFKP